MTYNNLLTIALYILTTHHTSLLYIYTNYTIRLYKHTTYNYTLTIIISILHYKATLYTTNNTIILYFY